jgi:hypothetical protein
MIYLKDKKKDGLSYNGGSRVFNYADAMQYYGITDGNNRYKAVYDQVSSYLVDLKPCGFNETCKDGVVPYEDAVNLYFLKVLQMLMLVKLKSHILKLKLK